MFVKQFMIHVPPFSFKDALRLKTQFQPFMMLPEERQGALYCLFQDLLLHEEMVTQLEDVVTARFLNTHCVLFKAGFLLAVSRTVLMFSIPLTLGLFFFLFCRWTAFVQKPVENFW